MQEECHVYNIRYFYTFTCIFGFVTLSNWSVNCYGFFKKEINFSQTRSTHVSTVMEQDFHSAWRYVGLILGFSIVLSYVNTHIFPTLLHSGYSDSTTPRRTRCTLPENCICKI
jgi:hypothetical protein